MNLPITTAKPVDIAGAQLLDSFETVGGRIQGALINALNIVAGSPAFTLEEFWANQGTNGATVLNAFSSLAQALASVYPELMTPEIEHAGDNLIVNKDGSVTVKS